MSNYITDIKVLFTDDGFFKICDKVPVGYRKLEKTCDGKRADLNRRSGGRDIYLAYTHKQNNKYPVTGINVVSFKNSKSYDETNILKKYDLPYHRLIGKTPSGNKADLNKDSGGDDIYLILERNPNKKPIRNITVLSAKNSHSLPKLPPNYIIVDKTINGKVANLNSGSGGCSIFLAYRK